MPPGLSLFLLITAFFFSSCSTFPETGLRKKPYASPEARALLSALEKRNEKLRSFKGIGRITLLDNGKTRSARMAWVGLRPEKLRIEILASPGQRTASISSDGKWLYMLTLSDRRFYKKRLTDESLEKLVGLPVGLIDIREFLAGRTPILEHDHVMLGEKTDLGGQYLLILKKRGRQGLERVLIDTQAGNVRAVEMFDADGFPMYRAVLDRIKQIDGYRIPFRVVLSNDEGTVFKLDIEKYWADIPVDPSVFVLKPPE